MEYRARYTYTEWRNLFHKDILDWLPENPNPIEKRIYEFVAPRDLTIERLFGNPAEGDGFLPRRIFGGFTAANNGGSNFDALRELNPGLTGDTVPAGFRLRLSFDHMRGVNIPGFSTYGNYPGPGASAAYFARPHDVFDLAGKLHDFAYTINAVYFADRKRSLAYWSRIAKADYIFKLMTDAIDDPANISMRVQRFISRKAFAADPRLFLKGDDFINPLRFMPADWLLTPFIFLKNKPPRIGYRKRIPGRKAGQGGYRTKTKNNYYAIVPEEDTENHWKEAVKHVIPPETMALLESIDGDEGTAAIDLSDMFWSAPVGRPLS